MIKRGLALSLVLGVASIARGEAVDIVPQSSANPLNPAGTYDPGEPVTVDVNISQVGGSEHLLRLVQFNLTNTATEFSIDPIAWEASTGHYLDVNPAGGPPGVAAAYYYEVNTDLGPNPSAQLAMPAGGSVKVATLNITMPSMPGSYLLDLMNAGEADPELHARVSYGFGCDEVGALCDNALDHPDETLDVTFVEAGVGLTDGTYMFTVANEAGIAKWESIKHYPFILEEMGPMDIGLEILADGTFSEPRVDGVTKITVTFSGPVDRTRAENVANIVIDGCSLMTPVDVSGTYTPTLRADDMTLDLVFSPSMPGETVYEITLNNQQTVGGRDVTGNTMRTFAVLFGDQDPTNEVAAADLSGIRSLFSTFTSPSNIGSVRADLDLTGEVVAADYSAARSNMGDIALDLCP